jgi:hypothetical protein
MQRNYPRVADVDERIALRSHVLDLFQSEQRCESDEERPVAIGRLCLSTCSFSIISDFLSFFMANK